MPESDFLFRSGPKKPASYTYVFYASSSAFAQAARSSGVLGTAHIPVQGTAFFLHRRSSPASFSTTLPPSEIDRKIGNPLESCQSRRRKAVAGLAGMIIESASASVPPQLRRLKR